MLKSLWRRVGGRDPDHDSGPTLTHAPPKWKSGPPPSVRRCTVITADVTLGPNVDWAGAFDATTTFASALTIGLPTGAVTLAPSALPVRL